MATITSIDLSDLDGSIGFRIRGVAADDGSGWSVSSAGDVNGDGFDDVIVGAPGFDPDGRSGAGAAFVLFGSDAGFAADVDLGALDGSDGFRIDGIVAGDAGGWSVSSAGDVNGDGIDDVIVGAVDAGPGGRLLAGQIYVVFGSDLGFAATIDPGALDGSDGFRINGVAEGDLSGMSVSRAGDVNGDGIDDLIVGAPGADPDGRLSAGESYVVFGTDAGFAADFELSALDGSNGFRISGIDADDLSGVSVSSAGDVNGDGIDDLIVGASGASPIGRAAAGESYVVLGTDAGFAAEVDLGALDGSNGFRLNGISEDDASGYSVSAAGDVNGDGIDDLIVGAISGDPGGRSAAGESYVVFGSDAGFAAVRDFSGMDGSDGFRINGLEAEDFSGWSVSSAGDVNGDGIDDLIVGAYFASPDGRSRAGASYVVFGADTGFAPYLELSTIDGNNGFVIYGESADDESGYSVSAAGDLNGDGYDDLIVGAPYADPDGRDGAGTSYVIFGFALNAAPVAVADAVSIAGTRRVTIDVLGNDSDIDGDGLSVSGFTQGAKGSVVLEGDGTLTYSFVGDATGVDTFTYTLSDGFGGTAAETVTVSGLGDGIVYTAADGSETLGGSEFADILTGGAGRDVFTGRDAVDRLYGGAGNDRLYGGAGDDILEGGEGSDLLRGGDGTDTASYFGAGAGVTVSLAAADWQNTGGAGRDMLSEFENLTGSGFDDMLTGDDGANLLSGMAGADVLDGGDGCDTLSGGRDDDQLYGGKGVDRLWGSLGADALDGGGGADMLSGGAGDDVLTGGAGADTFQFLGTDGDGADWITDFAGGVDLIFIGGGVAFDDLQLTWVAGGVEVTWAAGGSVLVEGMELSALDAADFLLI